MRYTKELALCIYLLFVGQFLSAKTGIELNLKAKAQVHVLHEVQDADSDYIGRKDPTYHSTDTTMTFSSDLNEHNHDGSKDHSLTVLSEYGVQRVAPNVNFYSVHMKSEVSKAKGNVYFKLSMTDATHSSKVERYYRGGCCHNRIYEKLQNKSLEGEVVFRYFVPKGVRLIKVKTLNLGGYFGGADAVKVYNNYSRYIPGTKYIWVKPETNLEFKIKLNSSRSDKIKDSVVLQIEDVVEASLSKENFVDSIQYLFNVREEQGSYLTALDSPINQIEFLKTVLNALSNEEHLRAYLLTSSFNDVSKVLFLLMNTVREMQHLEDFELSKNIRAAMSLLLVEISKVYMDDISEFCHIKEVETEFSQSKVNVSGIEYVSFLSKRIIESFSHFSENVHLSFIDQFSLFTREGKTYSQVLQDRELVKKLKRSYYIFKETSGLQSSFFGEASSRIKTFVENFSSGIVNEQLSSIDSGIKSLSKQEQELVVAEMNFVRSFRSTNHNSVDNSELKNKLFALIDKKQSLQNEIASVLGFLSGTNSGLTDFMYFVESELMPAISYDSGSKFFESIKLSHYSKEHIDNLTSKVEKCIDLTGGN